MKEGEAAGMQHCDVKGLCGVVEGNGADTSSVFSTQPSASITKYKNLEILHAHISYCQPSAISYQLSTIYIFTLNKIDSSHQQAINKLLV